jgi:ectoine hydroxylase-related dioxygenase (phytanoyl-CoA dioxygenase family)
MIELNSDPDIVLVAHLPDRPGVVGGIEGGEEMFKVALEPSVLDLVEQLIGPDIVVWGSNVFAKPAGVGKEVQWHQEANYWPMRPLASASVWFAIDDATVKNGCMRFIPGSHHDELLPHSDQMDTTGVLQFTIEPDLVDNSLSRDVPVKAGHVAVLDTFVIHGSNANRSDQRRAALTVRYMPATSHYDRSNPGFRVSNGKATDYAVRPIWLVRGENQHPGNDFRIGHEGLDDMDEIAEAARRSR